jgi:hypothetical protein
MRRLIAISIFGFFVGAMTLLAFSQEAGAVPSFARKLKANCSMCHLAWPQLNEVGRDYKEMGYTFGEAAAAEEEQVISDLLRWDRTFPLSAVIVSRPYDDRDNGDRKVRALHEFELILAGVMYTDVSTFIEFEAEDENDFEPEVPHGVVGYHPLQAANLLLAYAPALWSDPYDTYSHDRRLTRGSFSPIDQPFGGADGGGGRLRDSRQTITVYGRPVDMIFYSAGYSGVAGDTEGENADTLHARVAVDVIPQLTVGALLMDGQWHTNGDRLDFNRIGIDAQADFKRIRITGAYIRAEDDVLPTGDIENDAFYVQGLYVMDDTFVHKFVPLGRYDAYETVGGSFDELTLNATFYFTENIKALVEFWTQLDTPGGVDEDNRITIQLAAGF